MEAGRLTPSVRLSANALTSGAHTTSSFSIPSGTTTVVVGICSFNDNTGQVPSSVSVDGHSATLIDSIAGTKYGAAIYKASGVSTGSGKTASYTLGATGTWFAMEIALEFFDGTPTYGAHATADGSITATTSALANSSGDLILSTYCSVDAETLTFGTGQTSLDETDDTTQSTLYGFTTETGTGTSDAQTVDNGHSPAIASTVVSFSTGAFDATPSISSRTTTSYTVSGSLSGAGTVKAVACRRGTTAPTIAEINAAHCTGGGSPDASGSQTPGGAPWDFAITLTKAEVPAYPVADLYVTDGTTRTSLLSSLLSPPSTCGAALNQACQFVTLSSVAIGGIASIATLGYNAQTQNFAVGDTVTGGTSGAVGQIMSDSDGGATGTLTLWISSGTFQNAEALTGALTGSATVNGTASFLYAANDVLTAPTYVSPCGSGCPLTIGTDGNASYTSGTERETALNIKVYDDSAQGFASGDIDMVNNDQPPSCGGVLNETLSINVAMTTLDLDSYCSDAEADTLTSTVVGTLPTGLSHNGSTNATSGTPTVSNSGVTIRYIVADIYNALSNKDVFYQVAAVLPTPDCTTNPTILATCETLYTTALSGGVTFATTARCSDSVASGYVIATSPKAGTSVPLPAIVGISYSNLSPCGSRRPMIDCLGLTPGACTALATTEFGTDITVNSTSHCPTVGNYSNGHVYAQTPSPGHPTTAGDTLELTYCP